MTIQRDLARKMPTHIFIQVIFQNDMPVIQLRRLNRPHVVVKKELPYWISHSFRRVHWPTMIRCEVPMETYGLGASSIDPQNPGG